MRQPRREARAPCGDISPRRSMKWRNARDVSKSPLTPAAIEKRTSLTPRGRRELSGLFQKQRVTPTSAALRRLRGVLLSRSFRISLALTPYIVTALNSRPVALCKVQRLTDQNLRSLWKKGTMACRGRAEDRCLRPYRDRRPTPAPHFGTALAKA